jgi:hypothetical protein
MRLAGGSAGLLRDGKTTTWGNFECNPPLACLEVPLSDRLLASTEGGIREPGLIHWPGKILPGISTAVVATYDIFATSVSCSNRSIFHSWINQALEDSEF